MRAWGQREGVASLKGSGSGGWRGCRRGAGDGASRARGRGPWPNLNQLPVELQTDHRVRAAFATPLQPVDTIHSLLVIGAYAVVFVVVSLLLIWRRDVLE